MYRCATGEAWPSIMLSCAPPKPCDPRTNMNSTKMKYQEAEYLTQAIISSSYSVIDTNGSSIVNLHDDLGPKVLASSGKLTKNTGDSHIDTVVKVAGSSI